ncbi:hypothetical protein [Acinetobacter brisouii]|uniref:hypothetical protein n=1 Tax=Acinetobacter brisouii TaxID=396323 RepID=UPI0035B478F4
MKKILFATAICMIGLNGCSKSEEPKVEAAQESPQQTTLTSKRVGSLSNSLANSPNTFFDELVNGRSQFTNEIQQVNSDTFKQIISNNAASVIVILMWKKTNPDTWESTLVEATVSKQADQDSIQAFMRLPDRLNDSNEIRGAMNKSISEHNNVNIQLANGAILLIENTQEEIHLTIK